MAEGKRDIRDILIINPFGIGDVLFTTPLVANLERQYPAARISFLSNAQASPVLAHNPRITRIFNFTRGDLKRVRRLSTIEYIKKLVVALAQMCCRKFDLIVDLSLVSQYSFIFRLTGRNNIIGLNYHSRGRFLTRKIDIAGYRDKHVVEYYMDVLRLLGVNPQEKKLEFYLPESINEWAGSFLRQRHVGNSDKFIAVIPGGGASWGGNAQAKQWPMEFFAKTADEIFLRHGCKILIFGSMEEKELCASLSRQMKTENIDLAGETNLLQMAALLKRCALVICNDGGPLHMSVALDVPTVSLFGPVDEKVYGPYPPDESKHKVITRYIDCRPCYADFKIKNCLDKKCLKEISPEQVIAAAEELLNASAVSKLK